MPINHGAAADPDGRRFYFSSEAEQTLHVVDGKTLQTTKKIPLTGRPNNISIAKDGSRVYVGIVSAPGAVDVIDTKTLETREEHSDQGRHPQRLRHARRQARDRRLDRRPRDDGHRSEDRRAGVDAVRGGRAADGVRGRIRTDRPSGSSSSSRTSTASRSWTSRSGRKSAASRCPTTSPRRRWTRARSTASPSHGLGVAPDGKTLWVTSRPNARVYTYSLPDLKLLPNPVDLGGRPDWVTFTPDSKLIYITTENTDIVARDRRRVAQGSRADQGGQGAEAQHHGRDAVSGLRSCRGAGRGSRPASRSRPSSRSAPYSTIVTTMSRHCARL